MSNAESSSAASTGSRIDALENKFSTFENQLSEVVNLLKGGAGPSAQAAPAAGPSAAADPPLDPADQATAAAEAFKVGQLQFSLPPPSAEQVGKTFATRRAKASTGKLNKFEKPLTVAPFPTKRFIPEPEGLFGRIKTADQRYGWEAEVLWNVGNNCENSLASAHRVTEALAAKDVQAATEAFAVLHQFLEASYSRVLERVDFFTDSLESGKSEAILIQKYLREDDFPYASDLYRSTKQKFAELRSQAYAKEFKKQKAAGNRRPPKGPGKNQPGPAEKPIRK